jgi:hypothetical protein
MYYIQLQKTYWRTQKFKVMNLLGFPTLICLEAALLYASVYLMNQGWNEVLVLLV